MKKPTPTQYAQALFSVLETSDTSSRDMIFDRFVALLSEDHMLHRAADIYTALQDIADEHTGTIRAQVKSAHTLSEEEKETIASYIRKKTHATNVLLEEKDDSSLLGGIDVRYSGRRIDGTLKTSVARLREALCA